MAHLLPWQAMGDTLKVGALIVAYLMLGKTMTRLYVVSEIVTSSFFILPSYSRVKNLDLMALFTRI